MKHVSEPFSVAYRSDMTSGWEKSLRSPLTFGLVSCGGVGAFLFTVIYIIEGVTQPGYIGDDRRSHPGLLVPILRVHHRTACRAD